MYGPISSIEITRELLPPKTLKLEVVIYCLLRLLELLKMWFIGLSKLGA
jgi:hypothetical protein